MNGDRPGEIQRVNTTLNLLWLGMFGALGIYVLIGLLLTDQLDTDLRQTASIIATIRPVFLLLSVLQIVLAFGLSRRLLGRPTARSDMPEKSTDFVWRMQRYQTAVLISLALAEAPGLLGLVYLVLSGDTGTFLIFVALSGVTMFALRPKRDALQQFVTRGRSVP